MTHQHELLLEKDHNCTPPLPGVMESFGTANLPQLPDGFYWAFLEHTYTRRGNRYYVRGPLMRSFSFPDQVGRCNGLSQCLHCGNYVLSNPPAQPWVRIYPSTMEEAEEAIASGLGIPSDHKEANNGD